MAVEAGWLWFWRKKRGKKNAAESICRALSEDERVTDLEDLPVEEILTALKKQYPKIRFDRKNLPSTARGLGPRSLRVLRGRVRGAGSAGVPS